MPDHYDKKKKKKDGGWKVYEPKGFPRFSGAGPRRDKKLKEAECKALGIKKEKCK